MSVRLFDTARKALLLLVGPLMVVSACAGGEPAPATVGTTSTPITPAATTSTHTAESEATTTTGRVATTTSTVPPSTSPPASPSTTTWVLSGWPGVEVLVSNEDGVFFIGTTGEVIQLVKGRVAFAVDDTRGGLLFQVDGGRKVLSGAGYVGEPPRYDRRMIEDLSFPSTAV